MRDRFAWNIATSPPARNAGPAPRSTTARAPASAAASSQAARSELIITALSAFITSGRLSVMVATPSDSE